jgi:hypothetical protein
MMIMVASPFALQIKIGNKELQTFDKTDKSQTLVGISEFRIFGIRENETAKKHSF